MSLEDLGNLGEALGGLAVIVTLVYLAIQIRQNANVTRAQMHQQHLLSLENDLLALGRDAQASHVWNTGLRNWDDLTREEQGQFGIMMAGLFTGFESNYNQHRAGLLDEYSWSGYRTRLRWYVARKGMRSWWKLGGRTWVSEAYGDIIDEMISEFETSVRE